MIDLGSAEFNLAIPSLSRRNLELAANKLFDQWDRGAVIGLSLDDYSISLVVEEGSVKGLGKIAASAAILYLGIGNYGDFVQGLRTINEQVVGVRDYLVDEAPKYFGCPPELASTKKQAGATEKLNALFNRVRRGDLSPDQATERAMQIFGESGDDVSDLIQAIRKAFRNCPVDPRQSNFPFVESIDDLDSLVSRPPRPGDGRGGKKPLVPISNQFRVEVWRESKGKSKQTKVTRLR